MDTSRDASSQMERCVLDVCPLRVVQLPARPDRAESAALSGIFRVFGTHRTPGIPMEPEATYHRIGPVVSLGHPSPTVYKPARAVRVGVRGALRTSATLSRPPATARMGGVSIFIRTIPRQLYRGCAHRTRRLRQVGEWRRTATMRRRHLLDAVVRIVGDQKIARL